MRLFYSIKDLEEMLGEHRYSIAAALKAAGVTMTDNGDPADLSGWTGGAVFHGNNGYINASYYDKPDPSKVFVLADALPSSWVGKIQAASGETEGNSGVDRDKSASSAPLSRQRFQEQEILRVIGELGCDALKLPKDVSGKPGVKAEVRGKLSHHKWTDSVFNKAWERLSANNEIIKLK